MAQSTKFGKLLTEAIWRIKFLTSKPVEVIQEELGYAIKKKGGASIERWRQGYLPANLSDLEALTRNLVDQTDFEPAWFEEFLHHGDHPHPERFCHHLFPPTKESRPIAIIVYIQPNVDVRRANTDRLIPAQFAMPLYRGDVIYAYAKAVVHLVCSNGLLFNVTEESNLTISCQHKPDDKRIIGHWDTVLGNQLLQIAILPISDKFNLPDITEAETVIQNTELDSKFQAYLLAQLYRRYRKWEAAIDQLEWLTGNQNITSTYLSQQLGELYYQLGGYAQSELIYQDKKVFFDRIHFIQDRYEEIVTYYQQTLTTQRKASIWIGEDEAKYSASTREQTKEIFFEYVRSLARELVSVMMPDLTDDFTDTANLFFTKIIAQSQALKANSGFSQALSLGGEKLEILELLVTTYITTQLIVEILSTQEIETQLEANQLQETARQQAENVAQGIGLGPQETGRFAENYAMLVASHNLEALSDLIKP